MSPPNFRAARKCIFCGEGNLSKEHFYSDWMRDLLPDGSGHGDVEVENHPLRGTEVIRDASRPSSILTKKLRVVCKPCNEGWMNTLERQARPHITKLISGEPLELDEFNQLAVARWIALKCIVSEHNSRTNALTPLADRISFKERLEIPPYFKIYLIAHKSEALTGYIRRAIVGSLPGRPLEPPLDGMAKNMQQTMFLLGRTLVYVNAVRIDGFDFEDKIRVKWVHDSMRVWPKQHDVFRIPTGPLFGDRHISQLLDGWDTLIHHPKVRWGGEVSDIT